MFLLTFALACMLALALWFTCLYLMTEVIALVFSATGRTERIRMERMSQATIYASWVSKGAKPLPKGIR